jgi:hypothetical protein
MTKAKPVAAKDVGIPSDETLRKLLALREAGSPGNWYIDHGLMAKSLWITTHLREMPGSDRDGSICSVSAERTISRPSRLGSQTHEITQRPIKRAREDAELIIGAVNALPTLVRALLSPRKVDDAAWLIEWPSDRHGPNRYYSPGEPPVIDPNEALRFCREADATRVMRAEKLAGCAAVEHLWMGPATPS